MNQEQEADDPTTDQVDGEERPTQPAPSSFDVDTIRSYLVRGAVLLLGLLAALATFRFYSSASRAIDVWLAPRYQPLFQAGFNLVVVLAAIVAIVVITRRYRDT